MGGEAYRSSMAYQVLERSSRYSAGWFPCPGLDDCPDETLDQAKASVAETNRVAGWTRYMVIPKLNSQYDINYPPCEVDA
jgi:hypothetical protein